MDNSPSGGDDSLNELKEQPIQPPETIFDHIKINLHSRIKFEPKEGAHDQVETGSFIKTEPNDCFEDAFQQTGEDYVCEKIEIKTEPISEYDIQHKDTCMTNVENRDSCSHSVSVAVSHLMNWPEQAGFESDNFKTEPVGSDHIKWEDQEFADTSHINIEPGYEPGPGQLKIEVDDPLHGPAIKIKEENFSEFDAGVAEEGVHVSMISEF
jgi:hypothetical protein